MFCTLDTNYNQIADELAQMSGLVDQKKLIGGYHKEIGPFFPLCVRLVSSSKCVTE